MLAINHPNVVKTDVGFLGECPACQEISHFAIKASALRMVTRGSCRRCKKDYRSVAGKGLDVYKTSQGRWATHCPSCGGEQTYTRKDHAKQSCVAGWNCKKCASKNNKHGQNKAVGALQRIYNRFQKSATNRGIRWAVTIDQFIASYTGRCALTGWALSTEYRNCTASLDRIDSSQPYTADNVQWVHTMVNMSKNKYPQEEFIKMCKAVALHKQS